MRGPLGLIVWTDTMNDPSAITPFDLYQVDMENKRKAETALVAKNAQENKLEVKTAA